jgi:hypothetical protein
VGPRAEGLAIRAPDDGDDDDDGNDDDDDYNNNNLANIVNIYKLKFS